MARPLIRRRLTNITVDAFGVGALIKSRTSKTDFHAPRWNTDGSTSCTCPARKTCWAVKRLLEYALKHSLAFECERLSREMKAGPCRCTDTTICHSCYARYYSYDKTLRKTA